MPKEIYKKNIKKLDKEIKSTSEDISKLKKNRDKFYSKANFNKPTTMKEYEKIVKESPELVKLAQKNVKAKRLKRENQDKLSKMEKKGLI